MPASLEKYAVDQQTLLEITEGFDKDIDLLLAFFAILDGNKKENKDAYVEGGFYFDIIWH